MRIADLPQAGKVATSLLLVNMLVPPPREFDFDVPSLVVHLAVNLVASAVASPRRALLESDDGLVAGGLVGDDKVADELEVLGASDEVAAARRSEHELSGIGGKATYTKEDGLRML